MLEKCFELTLVFSVEAIFLELVFFELALFGDYLFYNKESDFKTSVLVTVT